MQVATILVIAASLVKLVTSSPLTFVSSTYNNTPTPTPTTTVSAHAGCDIILRLKDIPLLFHLMIVH